MSYMLSDSRGSSLVARVVSRLRCERLVKEGVETEARGEGSTTLVLNFCCGFPGPAVYSGRQFPGNRDADVDHAVAFGVYLLDSKPRSTGRFDWAGSFWSW